MSNRSPWNIKPPTLPNGKSQLPAWTLPKPTCVPITNSLSQKRIPLSSNQPLFTATHSPRSESEESNVLSAFPIPVSQNLINSSLSKVRKTQIPLQNQISETESHKSTISRTVSIKPEDSSSSSLVQKAMQVGKPITPIKFNTTIYSSKTIESPPPEQANSEPAKKKSFEQPTNASLWQMVPRSKSPPHQESEKPKLPMRTASEPKMKKSMSTASFTDFQSAFRNLSPSESILTGGMKKDDSKAKSPITKSESVMGFLQFMERRIKKEDPKPQEPPPPPKANEPTDHQSNQNILSNSDLIREQLHQLAHKPDLLEAGNKASPGSENKEEYVPAFFKNAQKTFDPMKEPECANDFERSLFQTKSKRKSSSQKKRGGSPVKKRPAVVPIAAPNEDQFAKLLNSTGISVTAEEADKLLVIGENFLQEMQNTAPKAETQACDPAKGSEAPKKKSKKREGIPALQPDEARELKEAQKKRSKKQPLTKSQKRKIKLTMESLSSYKIV